MVFSSLKYVERMHFVMYVHVILYQSFHRWDINVGAIAESGMKDLYEPMPVMLLKALTVDKQDNRALYSCPIYKTRQRGPTYVWTFNLRTKNKPTKWILAGVALIMQV